MRKSADAVILMQQNSNFTLLYPENINWETFTRTKPLPPFSEEVIDYLNTLSASLLKDRECRLYPDVVTFAFFCRKANLLKLKDIYIHEEDVRLGRGIAFHIAPSNVPINFAYSLVAGMLSGNINIVRISSKDFPQVNLVIKHMKAIGINAMTADIQQDDFPKFALVRYSRESDATAFFSSIAATRIIWGGDATISAVRKNELPPRSFDICFADRYSIAAINPDAILATDDREMKRIAEGFYNDTYLFDQNACSAPHLLFWIKSDNLDAAKQRFWKHIHGYVSTHYNLQSVLSVDKLTAFYRQAVCMDTESCPMPDNYILRSNIISDIPENIDSFRCAGGYFSEKDINSLNDITGIISKKYQTLAYYGFDKNELNNFVRKNRLTGLDRIVPIGKTTEFSLTWDGYNLIDMMSRIVTIY